MALDGMQAFDMVERAWDWKHASHTYGEYSRHTYHKLNVIFNGWTIVTILRFFTKGNTRLWITYPKFLIKIDEFQNDVNSLIT